MVKVDRHCSNCRKTTSHEVLTLDKWEDRITLQCSTCGLVVDTPIGYEAKAMN